ncbi:UNVERIFIED_CONTAM: hypothetical protein Slati_4049800 [Sesamum latifolium]|uniref:Uncharacterized protein n=1 Tax=Sesamum latifolium TaxID=2727402 RepID=A0AAW2TSC6_9LAMI
MLMVETDEGSPVIMDQIFTLEEECKDVFIDVEAFLRVVGPPQLGSRVENLPFVDGLKGRCMPAVGNEFKKPSPTTLSNDYSEIQGCIQGKKNIPSITSNDIISRASEVVNDVSGRKSYVAPCELSATEGIRWPSSSSLSLIPCKNNGPRAKDEKEETVLESRRTFRSVSMAGETPVENSAVVAHELGPVLQFPQQPAKLPLPPVKAENDSLKMENEVPKKNSHPSKITYQGVQNDMTRQSNVDCDSDVCILEDMSAPASESYCNEYKVDCCFTIFYIKRHR